MKNDQKTLRRAPAPPGAIPFRQRLVFILAPNGYTHEKFVQGHGTPYGSSSTSGQNSAKPTVDELVVVKHQGARVTQVGAALKAAR